MLEETIPPYSHIAQMYVSKRTDVWPPACRRLLPRRVLFGHRRIIELGLSRFTKQTKLEDVGAELIPSTRTDTGQGEHYPMPVLCREW